MLIAKDCIFIFRQGGLTHDPILKTLRQESNISHY